MTQSDVSGALNVFSGVGAGVEGAYVQFIASTSFAAKWIFWSINNPFDPGANIDVEIDIATGLGGSEVDDYADIYCRNRGGATRNIMPFNMPVNIPSGSRVSMRIKDNDTVANNYQAYITLTDDTMPLGNPINFQFLGPVTFLSGPAVDLDGSWVQLSASLANKADYFMAFVHPTFNIEDELGAFDIGTGGAGSELERLNELGQARHNSLTTRFDQSIVYQGPISLDAGVRVVCRIKDFDAGAHAYRFGMAVLTY